jgi:hypothetical protein
MVDTVNGMANRSTRLPDRPPAPEELVGLLADPLRRRVVALLDGHDLTADELIAATAAVPRVLFEQLGRLESARVVVNHDGRYELDPDVFHRSVREAAAERVGPLNDEHTQLARRFFYRNRLLQMPSEPWAVEVVLGLIAEDFQPGEVYSEREVNTTLYGWFGDWALLRRLLVDHGHLVRDNGVYRRAGIRRRTAGVTP